jgi:predicted small lipoprotein YifL
MRHLTLLALLATLLAAGCGHRGPLVPPEEADARPAPVGTHA